MGFEYDWLSQVIRSQVIRVHLGTHNVEEDPAREY